MELLEPRGCIDFFKSLWGEEKTNHELIVGGEEVEITENIIPDLECLNDSEQLLNRVFSNILSKKDSVKDIEPFEIQEAVYLLDAIYHTRLEHHIQIANIIYEGINKCLLSDILSVTDLSSDVAAKCVDYIACAGKKVNEGYNYAYSFATKFCGWLNPKGFIIMDGIAAGLLSYYIDKKLEANCQGDLKQLRDKKMIRGKKLVRSSLGDYKKYTEIYKLFIEWYDLKDHHYTYKDVDMFIWTYGRILINYFKEECPFTLRSIDYCPLS